MGGVPLLLHALTGCPLPLKVVPLRGTWWGGVGVGGCQSVEESQQRAASMIWKSSGESSPDTTALTGQVLAAMRKDTQ